MTSKRKPRMTTRSQTKKARTLEDKSEALYEAVVERNSVAVKQFLAAGAKPDLLVFENLKGYTSFHAALPFLDKEDNTERDEGEDHKHVELLDLLADRKYNQHIDIFKQDSVGMNPFECACADGRPLCVRWFLAQLTDRGDDSFAQQIINRQNPLGTAGSTQTRNQTPIHLAIMSEDEETVKALCSYRVKPDVAAINSDGTNAILLAVQRSLPAILRRILCIAFSKDLQVRYQNMTPYEYAKSIYFEYLQIAIEPKKILQAWQCWQLLQYGIDDVKQTWTAIRSQPLPAYNAIMTFWKETDKSNPNTNIHHSPRSLFDSTNSHPIHQDVISLVGNESNSKLKLANYRAVSLQDAFRLQHANKNWITTHRGALNVAERHLTKQKMSPFVQQYQNLRNERRKQLGLECTDNDNEHERSPEARNESETSCTSNNAHNKNQKAVKRASPAIFRYNEETVAVRAINEELEHELTAQDRVYLLELSRGQHAEKKKVQIMEIQHRAHPAKRHNPDAAVFGLFATEHIHQKEIIMEYVGEVQTKQECTAQINEFERFDGQHRTHELDTFKTKDSFFIVNASYFCNESVFVNDGTKDDVFKRWCPRHNVSFFEILINGWPHMFLRCFNDIKPGDELLTEYGPRFWKQYEEDMKKSRHLNLYYEHRKQRERETAKLKQYSGRKRKQRECLDEVEVNDDDALPLKQRKIDESTVEEQRRTIEKLKRNISTIHSRYTAMCKTKQQEIREMGGKYREQVLKTHKYKEKYRDAIQQNHGLLAQLSVMDDATFAIDAADDSIVTG